MTFRQNRRINSYNVVLIKYFCMDNIGLILPLNLISRNLGDSLSDQLKIRTLVRQIEQVEPELAAKIRKLFEEPYIF